MQVLTGIKCCVTSGRVRGRQGHDHISSPHHCDGARRGSAGFSRAQLIEVLVGIAQRTLSNYLNHLAETPVDAPFQPFAWTPASREAAAVGV